MPQRHFSVEPVLYLYTLIFPLGGWAAFHSFYLPSAFLLHFHFCSYCWSLFLPFSFNYLPTSSFRSHFLCFLSFHMYVFPGFPIPCLSVASLPRPFHLSVALSCYTLPLPPIFIYLFIVLVFHFPSSFVFSFFPGVKVNTSGFNSRADAESKTSYTHGSNLQRFRSYELLKYSK